MLGSNNMTDSNKELVQAILPHVATPVVAMIKLQLLTGMRPGEVVILRACDLDMTGAIWLYRPGSDQARGVHKTAWRDHERIIAVGFHEIAWMEQQISGPP